MTLLKVSINAFTMFFSNKFMVWKENKMCFLRQVRQVKFQCLKKNIPGEGSPRAVRVISGPTCFSLLKCQPSDCTSTLASLSKLYINCISGLAFVIAPVVGSLSCVIGDCPIAPSIELTADSSVSRSIVVEAIKKGGHEVPV